LRMCRARELLLSPGAQIKQIARQVGYTSPRHFSKLFKRQFGSYPSKFRKSRDSDSISLSVENNP
ncbi:MAG: helix-turn-helix domain-containing protein, partial [Spirochaetota bacterium]